MYAFVVMVLLNGTPHFVIMERGLTHSACEELAARPDSGLRIDGKPAGGEGRCIAEDKLPEIDLGADGPA
ncbi:MAG: hypothetical protein AB7S70_15460 [Hyphomicrobium sp.]|uniref:hypothetical protein n=1 Tax=Hyphomicrobium sp. TaxID=82 RepID=UPI003D143FF7